MFKYLRISLLIIGLFLCSKNLAIAEIKPPNPLWQILSTNRKDAHKMKYVAGDPDEGSFTVMLPYNVPNFDSFKIYISPKYRDSRLDLANRLVTKKINKLKAKMNKKKSKNEDITKLQDKLSKLERDLYKPAEWDNSKDLSILFFPKGMGKYLPGRPIKHFILTKEDKLVCKPVKTEELTLSLEDKKYISKIYGYIPSKAANYALQVIYNPLCITSKLAYKEALLFDSVSFDEDFAHVYGIPSYTKNTIRADFE